MLMAALRAKQLPTLALQELQMFQENGQNGFFFFKTLENPRPAALACILKTSHAFDALALIHMLIC